MLSALLNKTFPSFLVGERCDVLVDLCSSHPCDNAVDCTPVPNDFTCTCLPGFSGKFDLTIMMIIRILFICLFVYLKKKKKKLFVCQFVCLFIYLFIFFPFVYLFIFLFICLFIMVLTF